MPIKEKRRIVAFKFSLYLPEDIKRAKRREELEALKQQPDTKQDSKTKHKSTPANDHKTDSQEGQDAKKVRELTEGVKNGLARLREELA